MVKSITTAGVQVDDQPGASRTLSVTGMENAGIPDKITFVSGTFDITRYQKDSSYFQVDDLIAFESASMAIESAKWDAELSRELLEFPCPIF